MPLWFGLSPFLDLFLRDYGCGKAMSFVALFLRDRCNKESQTNDTCEIQFS